MGIITHLKNFGHISEAVYHFNHALDMKDRARSAYPAPVLPVYVARTLFDGLNKVQTEWLLAQADRNLGEVKAFTSMILRGLTPKDKATLIRSSELRKLVFLNPKIMMIVSTTFGPL